MTLAEWAVRWRVPAQQMAELHEVWSLPEIITPLAGAPGSEARVQSQILLEAPKRGFYLFRNNVGALKDDRGVPVRYGLCNDSKSLNERFKSADLIGIAPGGRFVSIECKEPGWRYTGKGREAAQLRWLQLVLAAGGIGCFATSPDNLPGS